jgi:hypothetical protein
VSDGGAETTVGSKCIDLIGDEPGKDLTTKVAQHLNDGLNATVNVRFTRPFRPPATLFCALFPRLTRSSTRTSSFCRASVPTGLLCFGSQATAFSFALPTPRRWRTTAHCLR